MGREIRKVPPNWEHPKYEDNFHPPGSYPRKAGDYIPLRQGYTDKLASFSHDIGRMGLGYAIDYWGGGPKSKDYVKYREEDATWFQVYETVSEGTPLTPPFSTKEEIVEYLVNHGDFWRQKHNEGGYTRKAAEAFIELEWAPSFSIDNGQIKENIESLT